MTLADADFDNITAITKRSDRNKRLCNWLKFSIKMHMHERNSYFKEPDMKVNKIIMYVQQGTLYKQLCTKINKIT
jgi:hypothetical protein